jgi:hypothetical protein
MFMATPGCSIVAAAIPVGPAMLCQRQQSIICAHLLMSYAFNTKLLENCLLKSAVISHTARGKVAEHYQQPKSLSLRVRRNRNANGSVL